MAIDIKMLNRLRRTSKAHWEAEAENPQPIVVMSKDPEGCDAMMEAFRTIASEMGLRHAHLCLVDGFTDEHQKMLDRNGPRIVTITDIDGYPQEELSSLNEKVAKGSRTLVACLIHAPEEDIPQLAEAWRAMQKHRQE